MKKVITFLLICLLLTAGPAVLAADWGNPQTVSPYSVGIIPVKETTTLFGQKSYTQDFGAASAGDSVSFAIRVEVPAEPRPAILTLKGSGATINAALTASLPDTPGVYYFHADGTFSANMAPITAYCTGVPTVRAEIRGTEKIESIGGYQIIRSDGFIFTNGSRGMSFHTDAQGCVYASHVFGPDYKHRMTAALMAENGEPAAVARGVLQALSMDPAALLSGNVFITERLLSVNFGVLVDTETEKTWAHVLPQATPYVNTITYPPATGGATVLPVVCMGASALIATVARRVKRRGE